ncbi:MAG: hypothetical protein FJX75_22375, partial [Armatimonadetes bacterium]|nr:hypothetical protein [Armatimonadota bacterium]
AVEDWFLPDGGSSESPAYALMTMGGIDGFGLMFRGYSDPAGYAGPDAKRFDDFDACRDTRYGDCWQSLIWTLQGNLRHPPSADSYRTTSIGASFAELIAVGYPSDEHLALLKELAGPDLAGGSAEQALLYREPGLEAREVPPFALPDVVFPFLAQGYLRTGATGRDSLALLNASDWGGHHHLDSLDFYYWKDGRELLSDLGYLWDHPDSYQTRRTFSHNLVLIDGADQRGAERGGSFHLFSVTPRVKVMEASSRAYADAEVFRRTCVQIDHGEGGSYLLDIFRVKGGRERQYVFHGPATDFQVEGLSPEAATAAEKQVPFAVRLHCGAVGEVYVDDAEVRRVMADGSEGPNLAENSSLATGDVGKPPPGWGLYSGDGKADSGVFEPGRDDLRCVRFRALAPHENGRMNAALLIGASDGYTGREALPGVLGATYRVRFWLRGNAPKVTVGAVLWPNDPSSAADRAHLNMLEVTPAGEWTQYQAEVTLPSNALPLTNIRQASGKQPWHITWPLAEDYQFAAFVPGNNDETVLIGDGWGQRDHRNTDRGATLPYVVRSRQGGGLDAFVSVFAGAPTGKLPVTGVRLLDVPANAPEGTVAVEVTTPTGVDVIVSMLTPQPLTVQTPLGPLTTDGALGAVLGSGTTPQSACLVGGTRLEVGEARLSSNKASPQGTVQSVGSAPGESWFVLDAPLPEGCVGQTLFVEDAQERRAYPIRAISGTKVYTKQGNVGVEAREAERWEFPMTLAWEAP